MRGRCVGRKELRGDDDEPDEERDEERDNAQRSVSNERASVDDARGRTASRGKGGGDGGGGDGDEGVLPRTVRKQTSAEAAEEAAIAEEDAAAREIAKRAKEVGAYAHTRTGEGRSQERAAHRRGQKRAQGGGGASQSTRARFFFLQVKRASTKSRAQARTSTLGRMLGKKLDRSLAKSRPEQEGFSTIDDEQVWTKQHTIMARAWWKKQTGGGGWRGIKATLMLPQRRLAAWGVLLAAFVPPELYLEGGSGFLACALCFAAPTVFVPSPLKRARFRPWLSSRNSSRPSEKTTTGTAATRGTSGSARRPASCTRRRRPTARRQRWQPGSKQSRRRRTLRRRTTSRAALMGRSGAVSLSRALRA